MSGTIYGPLTDTYISYVDGTGNPHTQFISQSAGSSPITVPWNVLVDPDTGIRAGSNTPYPVQAPGIAPQYTNGVPEASHLFQAADGQVGPCTLAAFQINTQGVSGWVLLYDESFVPDDGIQVPIKSWQVGQYATLDWHGYPIKLLQGCVLVFSSTGPFVQTSSATAIFSAEVR